MRFLTFAWCMLLAGYSNAQPVDVEADFDADLVARCEAVEYDIEYELLGRTLKEAPDLPPELRKINVMSNVDGCFSYSRVRLAAFVTENPDEHRASFVMARFGWRTGQMQPAMNMLEAVLAEHPNFASAMVLIGAMYNEVAVYDHALAWLNQAQALSPDDLWLTVNLLKAQAGFSESETARAQLLELASAPSAPFFVRVSCTDFLLASTDKGSPQREILLRSKFEYSSGTERDRALLELSEILAETRRYSEAHLLLAEMTPNEHFPGWLISAQRAELFLREAADIAPAPTPENQALIEKARQVVDGDFNGVAIRLGLYPDDFNRLVPLLVNEKPIDPNARSPVTRSAFSNTTILCMLVTTYNVEGLLSVLPNDADVNADCGMMTPLANVAHDSNADTEIRRQMVMILLDAGADIDRAMGQPGLLMSSCEMYPYCKTDILPLLQAHRDKLSR